MPTRKPKSVKKNGNGLVKKLCETVMQLFGRRSNKYLFLSSAIIQRELKEQDIDLGVVETVAGALVTANELTVIEGAGGGKLYIPRAARRIIYNPREIVENVGRTYFDRIYTLFAQLIHDGEKPIVNDAFYEKHDKIIKMPQHLFTLIVDCFVQAGLLKQDGKTGVIALAKGQDAAHAYADLQRVFVSKELFDLGEVQQKPVFKDWGEVESMRAVHKNESRITRITVPVRRRGFKVLNMAEFLIGHQDYDAATVNRILEHLESLARDEKKRDELPDVIILTGLVQGAFKQTQLNNRHILDIHSESQQFSAAKMVFDRFRALTKANVHLVLNSDNDKWRICRDATFQTLRMMKRIKDPQSDDTKQGATYWQQNQLQKDKAYVPIFNFQWDVVFVYCLLCGRTLHSADESEKKGGPRMEEIFMLRRVWKALVEGKEAPAEFLEIVEKDNIPIPGKIFDFAVADDCIIEFTYEGKVIASMRDYHNFTLTPNSMTQDPTKAVREITAQLAAQGVDLPNLITLEHQRMLLGFFHGNNEKTFIMSTPGLHTHDPNRSSRHDNIQSDTSHRLKTTRRSVFQAGATPITFTEDGRILIDFYLPSLMDKMSISKERVAVAWLSDWQEGSTTARPDYQVQHFGYLMHDVAAHHPLVLDWGGDHVQGRNYWEMANENRHIGLVRISDQIRFVKRFLRNIIQDVPLTLFKNLRLVGIVPGNHEWNSGHKHSGAIYTEFLHDLFEDCAFWRGIPLPVHTYESLMTRDGEFFRAWTGIQEIAGYTILMQHKALEKGAKGNSGLPVMALKPLISGLGNLLHRIDLCFFGHFHVPAVFELAGMLAHISGSLAGLSGYEYALGHRPVIGASTWYLGGNQPVRLELLTKRWFQQYKLKGYYSQENLLKLGFKDDQGYNPSKDCAFLDTKRQSALQRSLWALRDHLNATEDSTI